MGEHASARSLVGAARTKGSRVAYIDRILQPGETVIATARLHWIILLPSILLIAAAVVIAVLAKLSSLDPSQAKFVYAFAALVGLFGVLAFIVRSIRRATTEFAATNRRVIVKRGLFSLHTVEMNEDKVESVDVDQSILARILGYGTITIHGVGSRWDPIPRISDPLAFRSAITLRGASAAP
jgi:uncharacterized membrane protein YdbT with pleckstrin-like domain